MHSSNKISRLKLVALSLFIVGMVASVWDSPPLKAACQSIGADNGTVTIKADIPTTTTYRVWSRMMAPDSTHNSYFLEIDGDKCFYVGGNTAMPVNAWTWIDYQNENVNSKIDIPLTQGSHTLKLIGNDEGVKLDRVLFASDLTCIPSGNGDNCKAPTDTTAPTVSFTSPTDGANVSGQVNVAANATDNTGGSGMAKVEFYVNSTLMSTVTSSTYSFAWDTTKQANGTYTLTAKAYDKASNVASSTISATVQNTDSQAPTTPTELKANATSFNQVDLSWKASTDNSKVAGYLVFRNDSPIAQVTSGTAYQDKTVSANKTYQYKVIAYDDRNNQSQPSSTVSVTTPSAPVTDTQAPTKPTDLRTNVLSPTQINLAWRASSDNVGVAAYEIYRATGTGPAKKIATITTTSFGDANLQASTSYTYSIRAKDAAGNVSDPSDNVTAKTQAAPAKRSAMLWGMVTDSRTARPVKYAKIVLTGQNTKRTVRSTLLGIYAMGRLPAGSYSLTFRSSNYNPKSISTTLKDGEIQQQNIKLQRR